MLPRAMVSTRLVGWLPASCEGPSSCLAAMARTPSTRLITHSPTQLKVYGTGQLFNAVIVRSFANKLCTVAPDVCSPDSVREACDKARRLDPRYQALLSTTTTYEAPLGDDSWGSREHQPVRGGPLAACDCERPLL